MAKAISFTNKAVDIAGYLHVPDDFDENRKYLRSLGFTLPGA